MRSLLLAAALAVVQGFNELDYTSSKEIIPGGAFKMWWKVDGENLKIAMRAQTLGWVSFGFTEQASGSMPGSDILMGKVENGQATAADYYAVDFVTPELDAQQDWFDVGGVEENGFTTITATRKLVTDDNFDRPIVDLGYPYRIAIAWGDSDDFNYHGSNRLISSIRVFTADDRIPALLAQVADPNSTLSVWNTTVDYVIPSRRTTYHDTCFTIPNDMYVVAMLAILPSATKQYVHHITADTFADSDDCGGGGGLMNSQQMTIYAGPADFLLPDVASYHFGAGIGGARSMTMQMHYDNPDNIEGLHDYSGIMIIYDSKPRTYEAGLLQLGDPRVIWANKVIPQGRTRYDFECPGDCTEHWTVPEIHVFSSLLHMHQAGRQMITEVIRNDEVVHRTEASFFNFDSMDTSKFIEYTVQKGDTFRTSCTYNAYTDGLKFGLGSDEEMCIDFLFYYPRVSTENVGAFCGLWSCGVELPTSGEVIPEGVTPRRNFAYVEPPPTVAAPTSPPSAAPFAPSSATHATLSVSALLCTLLFLL